MLETPPAYLEARTLDLEEVLGLVNQRYSGVASLTVSRFDVEFTGGSIEDGYFEKYRKARGYLVAQGPDSIFVNILNPLTSSSVLVMASQHERFEIWVPSRNQFVTGRADWEAGRDNPVHNVRPAHILQGMLIEEVPRGGRFKYYMEEQEDARFKYYVLGVFEIDGSSPALNLLRKIWIERSRMVISKQQYFRGTQIESNIDYGAPIEIEGKLVSTRVNVERPIDRYSISFQFEPKSIQLNRYVSTDAFRIDPPPGAEVVELKEEG